MPSQLTHLHAIFAALRFQNADTTALRTVPWAHYADLLALADRLQLTLALGVRARVDLPEPLGARIANDLANNALRHHRLLNTHRQIDELLSAAGIRYVVLKGLSHWPGYCARAAHRPQSDVDIWCHGADGQRAAQVLGQNGWRSFSDRRPPNADHLPMLVPDRPWTWNGDYFDPTMPHPVEIHFRLWNPAGNGFDVEDLASFTAAAEPRNLDGIRLPALTPTDTLTFACLHLVRHLLQGSLSPRHVYDIAHFLHTASADDAFWEAWRRRQVDAPRRLLICAVAFRLAVEWFACLPHPIAAQAIEELPAAVSRWFQMFAWSPAEGTISPNKDEIWLHLALASPGTRAGILRRRILPLHLPDGEMLTAPATQNCAMARRQRRFRQLQHAGRRTVHHLRAALALGWSGARYVLAWRAPR